ncbi:sca1 complex scaffold protein scaa [Anaeramoeba flamelloides]|uniref:Sca1 complex scaffold protein scaa n=1 Tax=Anaeramoeba flamelloides TaxID=1746091 RepID=A0ABQ8X8E8_9EUKA|nr:sca1 complex scaffold protein scaa [Anaeramoeba flamelloides]
MSRLNKLTRFTSTLAKIPTYDGLRGTYSGPYVNVNEKIQPTHKEKQYLPNTPVFMDGNGNLFDIHYLPIKKTNTNFRQGELQQLDEFALENDEQFKSKDGRQKLISQIGCVNLNQIKPFPNPEDFEEYEDFEQAAIEWHKTSNEQIGALQLPQQIGSQQYRFVEIQGNTSEKAMNLNKTQSTTDTNTENDDLTENALEYDEIENQDMNEIELTQDETNYNLTDEQELSLFQLIQKPNEITKILEQDKRSIAKEGLNNNEKEMEDEKEGKKKKEKNENKEEKEKAKEKDKETEKEKEEEKEKEKTNENNIKNKEENKKEHFKKKTELNDYVFKKLPWDCLLSPPEPKPEYYLTLEGYERACRRWSRVVVSQLEYLPMHPSQLQDQAFLKSYIKKIKKKMIKKEKNDFFRGHSEWMKNVSSKIGRHKIQIVQKPIIPIPPPMPNYPITFIQDWGKLDGPTQQELKDFVQTLTKIQQINFDKYFSNQRIILGKYNTIFRNQKKLITQYWSRFHLTRNDVTQEESLGRNPFLQEKNQRPIIFTIPEYNHSRPIPWKTLYDTNEYHKYEKIIQNIHYSSPFTKITNNNLHSQIQKIDDEIILKPLYEILDVENFALKHLIKIFYLPQSLEEFKIVFINKNEKLSKKKIMKVVRKTNFHHILNVLKDTTNQIVHSKIAFFVQQILKTKKGVNIIKRYIVKNRLIELYDIIYYINYFQNIPVSIFPVIEEMKDLIQMNYGMESLIIRMRRYIYLVYYISLIKNGIQKNVPKMNSRIEELFTLLDTKKKEFETKIIKVLNKKTIIATQNLFEGVTKRNSEISIFFLFLIIRIFNIDDKKISLIFTREDVDMIGWIIEMSKSKFTHVKNASKVLWNFLKTRTYGSFLAKAISTKPNLFLNLLFNKNELCKVEKTILEKTFRKSSIQKIQWYFELKNKYFEDYQEEEYTTRNIDSSKSQLDGRGKGGGGAFSQFLAMINKNIITTPPFIVLASLEYFTWLLQQLAKNRSIIDLETSLIFTKTFFKKYLSKLEQNIKKADVNLACYGRFFEEYVKCLFELNLITVSKFSTKLSNRKNSPYSPHNTVGVRNKRKRSGSLTLKMFKGSNSGSNLNHMGNFNRRASVLSQLRVSTKINFEIEPEEIYQFFDLIKQAPEKEYEFKVRILNSIKYFLLNHSIYLFIYNDGRLFEQIKQFCFDSSDINFNRTAWDLFFKLVEYHSETVSYLIEAEQLKYFLTPSNDIIVIPNQLYCLNKIFCLPELEQNRNLEKQKTFRRYYEKEPLKSLRKDRRNVLNCFIKKLCFSRLHIIFKMFEKNKKGKAFVELSKIYFTIIQNNTCNKLYQEFKKTEEYAIGIQYFEKLTLNKVVPQNINRSSSKSHKKRRSIFMF